MALSKAEELELLELEYSYAQSAKTKPLPKIGEGKLADLIPGTLPLTPSPREPSLLEKAKGVGEAAASAISSGAMLPFQALSNIAGAGKEVLKGEIGKGTGEKYAEEYRRKLGVKTYEPLTETGKEYSGKVDKALENLAALGPMIPEIPVYSPVKAARDIAKKPVEAAQKGLKSRAEESAAIKAQRAPQLETSELARKYGMRVPPQELAGGESGVMAHQLRTLTEDVPLKATYSIHNNRMVGDKIRQEFGLPKSQALSKETFDNIIRDNGKVYDQIKSIERPFVANDEYLSSIGKLPGEYTETARKFPEAMGLPKSDRLIAELSTEKIQPKHAVELIKQLRQRASTHMDRAIANPAEMEMGRVYRRAAAAVEKLVEDNLSDNPALYNEFVKSRQTIAKAYDARSALHEGTGTFDATIFGKLYEDEAPMSGTLEDIGRMSSTYPDYFQPVKEAAGKVVGGGGAKERSILGGASEFVGIQPALRRILASRAIPWKGTK